MNLKRIERSIAVSLAILGTCGLATYTSNRQEKINKEANKSMEYVKAHSPNKYIEILEKSADKKTGTDLKLWEQTAREVRDSLRIDSIAKTNYAKGAQMVRDSITNANLNDTVRTVMKSVK